MPQRTVTVTGPVPEPPGEPPRHIRRPEPAMVPAVVVRVLETAFRRWWALLIPSLLVPLAVVLFVRSAPAYLSVGTVWVTRAEELDGSALEPDRNPFISPSQAQASVLLDLLRTRDFSEAVAQRAGLTEPGGYRVVQEAIFIAGDGTNLMRVSAKTPFPTLSQSLVDAVFAEYQERVAREAEREASIAITYFETQIDIAQQELDRRRAELAAYLVLHPLEGDDSKTDLNYLALTGAVESQSKSIEGLFNALDQVRRDAATTQQSLEARFSVRDAASFPEVPEPVSVVRRLGFPLAGMAFGLLIGAGYLYFVFRTDHAVRSREEIGESGLPVLGVVPVLSASESHGARALARRLAGARGRVRLLQDRETGVRL